MCVCVCGGGGREGWPSLGTEVYCRGVYLSITNMGEFRCCMNPFSTTGHHKHHPKKVKVKGLGRKSSYGAAFSISFFFHGSKKKSNPLVKKTT